MDAALTNKLYTELKNLAPFIKKAVLLPEHELNTAINNTLLALIKKMDDGSVPCVNYESYKHYMFISLTNEVLRYFQTINTKKCKSTQYTDDYLAFDNLSEQAYEESHLLEMVLNVIKTLPQEDKELMDLRLKGIPRKKIGEMQNVPEHTIKLMEYKIWDKIRETLKIAPPKKKTKRINKEPKTYTAIQANTHPDKNYKFKLLDTKTNEELFYTSTKEIALALDTSVSNVNICKNKNFLLRNKYYVIKLL